MRTAFGAGWRFALFLVVIVALAVSPLFLVYRSRCIEYGKQVDSWSLVAPWDDPPADCTRHETGFDVLRGEVGL
jgi:hypothetical protein